MANPARFRESLQDSVTLERLRNARSPAATCLASELLLAIALRDRDELTGKDTTASSRGLVAVRKRAVNWLYENSARLIAVPLRRRPELRLVAP